MSPAFICPNSTSETQAVSAAQGRQAASSSLSESGTATSDAAGKRASSASVPSQPPPRSVPKCEGCSGPSSQPVKKLTITLSPGLTLSTPSPTATTSPAPSLSGIRPAVFGALSIRLMIM